MTSSHELQSGYFLHARRFQETSVLLDCFTQEAGIISCVAKGAKRPKSKWRGLVQPFILVSLAWRGRGDVKTIIQLEAGQILPALTGKKVLFGFYINELILNLLHRADPHPDLFQVYQQTINRLREGDDEYQIQVVLRQFECQLLDRLGFGIDLTKDANGQAIEKDLIYGFEVEHGFYPQAVLPQSKQGLILSGATIHALYHGLPFAGEQQYVEAKKLMRQAVNHHLGNKTLKSRQYFKEMHYLAETQDSCIDDAQSNDKVVNT